MGPSSEPDAVSDEDFLRLVNSVDLDDMVQIECMEARFTPDLLVRWQGIYEAKRELAFLSLWNPFNEGELEQELTDVYLDKLESANRKRIDPKPIPLPSKASMHQAYRDLLEDKDACKEITFTKIWQDWDRDCSDPEAAILRRAEKMRMGGDRKPPLPSNYEEAKAVLLRLPSIPKDKPYYKEVVAEAKKIVHQHEGPEHQSLEMTIRERWTPR